MYCRGVKDEQVTSIRIDCGASETLSGLCLPLDLRALVCGHVHGATSQTTLTADVFQLLWQVNSWTSVILLSCLINFQN